MSIHWPCTGIANR